MNPSEEATNIVATTVAALKQSPAILAIVIFNVLFMLLLTYISMKDSSRWDAENQRLHALVEKVLASCSNTKT